MKSKKHEEIPKPQVIHSSNDWALHRLLFNNPDVKRRIAIKNAEDKVKKKGGI